MNELEERIAKAQSIREEIAQAKALCHNIVCNFDSICDDLSESWELLLDVSGEGNNGGFFMHEVADILMKMFNRPNEVSWDEIDPMYYWEDEDDEDTVTIIKLFKREELKIEQLLNELIEKRREEIKAEQALEEKEEVQEEAEKSDKVNRLIANFAEDHNVSVDKVNDALEAIFRHSPEVIEDVL